MPNAPQLPDKPDFVVVEYLFDVDPSGQYSPRLRVQLGEKTFTLADRERRKYRELNDALKADFEMAHRWRQKYAPGLPMVVSSPDARRSLTQGRKVRS
ncbi:MAG: hypothetical protein ACLQU2_37350 [Candidatus Binataceae bacterium]